MASCIRCNRDMGGADGISICLPCAGILVDGATSQERLALAQLGMDALVDIERRK